MNRVVITGMGVVAPNGHGLDAFETALREGRSGISHRPELAGLGFSCHVGGIPADLDILRDRYFEPSHLAGMDDSTVLGCIAGIDCWEDAGFHGEGPAPSTGTPASSLAPASARSTPSAKCWSP